MAVTAFRQHLNKVDVLLHDELLDEPVRCSVRHIGWWMAFIAMSLFGKHFDLLGVDRYFASLSPLAHSFALGGVIDVEVLFLIIESTASRAHNLVLFLLLHGCTEQGHLLVECKGLLAHLADFFSWNKPAQLID